MAIIFVACIRPLLIEFTDKRDIIQHNLFEVTCLGASFLGVQDSVNANVEDTSSITDTSPVECHINNLLFYARLAGFIGVGELKNVVAGQR